MKSVLTILVICGVAGITVFGSFVMNHGGSHNGCIASAVQNGICPIDDPIGFANFHLNALKSFSLAVFVNSSLNILLAMAVVFLALLIIGRKASLLNPLLKKLDFFKLKDNSSESNFTYWLSLHENSPSQL